MLPGEAFVVDQADGCTTSDGSGRLKVLTSGGTAVVCTFTAGRELLEVKMRSQAWREFLIGATCGLLLGLNWFLPRRGYGAPYLSPLLAGALVVYLARRPRNLAATGHGWRNDLVVTAKTGADAAVVYILVQNAVYYGMSGRGPFSLAFAPEHYVEWGFVKSLMTNTLIQGLTMVPLATIIGGFAAGFLLRAREHKSSESESSRERLFVR